MPGSSDRWGHSLGANCENNVIDLEVRQDNIGESPSTINDAIRIIHAKPDERFTIYALSGKECINGITCEVDKIDELITALQKLQASEIKHSPNDATMIVHIEPSDNPNLLDCI